MPQHFFQTPHFRPVSTLPLCRCRPGDKNECYTIRIACSLFAFMGLLFNSLSAAIIFSKLERVLTRASVSFCSTACLQFGKAALYTRGSKGVYGQFWMKNNRYALFASLPAWNLRDTTYLLSCSLLQRKHKEFAKY